MEFFFAVYRRQRECYYGDAFIASNKEVDKHIQKVYQGSKHSVCKLLGFNTTHPSLVSYGHGIITFKHAIQIPHLFLC